MVRRGNEMGEPARTTAWMETRDSVGDNHVNGKLIIAWQQAFLPASI
jgi:hypothetical protein